MAKKSNPVQQKQRAVRVVFSWMRSWNIDVRFPEALDEGDLVVDGKRVVFRDDRQAGEFDFALSPSAVIGPDMRATLSELHRLTQHLGRGAPAGFRDVTGMTRASPDDYLGVSMRLTPFGRTPNIPEEDLRKWLPTLKREADRAARRCGAILANMSLDKDDLKNIGLVYLMNFLSRHAPVGDEKATGKQLTMSLLQEYGRWADVTIRHLKNVSARVAAGLPLDAIVGAPHPLARVEGADYEASAGDTPDKSNIVGTYVMDMEDAIDASRTAQPEDDEPVFASNEEWEKYERRQAMREGRYLAKRRRNAKAALDLALSEMPHDRMVFVLSEVVDSHFQNPEAREEAARRLEEHRETCSRCATSTAPSGDARTPVRTESVQPA